MPRSPRISRHFCCPKKSPLKSGNSPPLMLLNVYRAKNVKVLKRKELQTLSLVAPERLKTTQPIIFLAPATDAIRPADTELVKRPRLSAVELKRRLAPVSYTHLTLPTSD